MATATAAAQADLDARLLRLLGDPPVDPAPPPPLARAAHAAFARRALAPFSSAYAPLAASTPWLLYWGLHSLAVLGEELDEDADKAAALRRDAIAYLAACAHPAGGYGGAPGAPPHLAPTYAAVCALATLGGDDALASIDRGATLAFIDRCAVTDSTAAPDAPHGGFRVCDGGEVDVRGAFTAAAVVTLLGGDTAALARRGRLTTALAAAATPEGGIGGAPDNEAHGGYAFCGAAAAALCGLLDGRRPPVDARRLATWAGTLQSPSVGGFAGRTSKLVDGCYSFWVGGLWAVAAPGGRLPPPGAADGLEPGSLAAGAAPPLPLPPPLPPGGVPGPIDRALSAADAAAAAAAADPDQATAADDAALAADVAAVGAALLACPPDAAAPPPAAGFDPAALQHWVLACCQAPAGGLRDKPGKPPDLYHTCYCLSGLAAAQAAGGVVGGPGNAVAAVHPLLNVVADKAEAAMAWFRRQGSV